jgi:hypothetical protein
MYPYTDKQKMYPDKQKMYPYTDKQKTLDELYMSGKQMKGYMLGEKFIESKNEKLLDLQKNLNKELIVEMSDEKLNFVPLPIKLDKKPVSTQSALEYFTELEKEELKKQPNLFSTLNTNEPTLDEVEKAKENEKSKLTELLKFADSKRNEKLELEELNTY